MNGSCAQSADCPTYQYCSMGTCTKLQEDWRQLLQQKRMRKVSYLFDNDAISLFPGICTEVHAKSMLDQSLVSDNKLILILLSMMTVIYYAPLSMLIPQGKLAVKAQNLRAKA